MQVKLRELSRHDRNGLVAATAGLAVLLVIWGVWAFGLPFSDRACHRAQAAELESLETQVHGVLPVSATDRQDHCRDGADASLIAKAPPDASLTEVRHAFQQADWAPSHDANNEYVSPDNRVHVSLGQTSGSDGYVEISAQRVGAKRPADD
jgi:hypothetical protein